MNTTTTALATGATLAPADLLGKVINLHAGADNYANIPLGTRHTHYTAKSTDATTATAKAGNTGDRIACGVIETR